MRTITIFSKNSLNTFGYVYNMNNFPCGSNIAITCNYTRGDSLSMQNYPLDWDRVDIFLSG